jgi:hypothetical protein
MKAQPSMGRRSLYRGVLGLEEEQKKDELLRAAVLSSMARENRVKLDPLRTWCGGHPPPA